MNIDKLLNPIKLLESAINGITQGFQAWRGFKLVIFGTTAVGKTTLWRYLETQKIVDPNSVEKTFKITKLEKFRLKTIRLTGIQTGILATDLPGDKEYRDSWGEVLKSVKPHGIIFLLDNVKDPANIPESGYDEARLAEHKEAFDYLTHLILENPEVSEHLRAMAIVVNKSDTLPPTLGWGKVLEKSEINTFFNQYSELENCRSTAFSCSALFGHNIPRMMKWMVRGMAGGED